MLETGPQVNKVEILCGKQFAGSNGIEGYARANNIFSGDLLSDILPDYPGNVTGRVIDLISQDSTNPDYALWAYLFWYVHVNRGNIRSAKDPNEYIELKQIINPAIYKNKPLLEKMMHQEEILKIVRKKSDGEIIHAGGETPILAASPAAENKALLQEVRKEASLQPILVMITQPNTNTPPNNPISKNAGFLNKAKGLLRFKAQFLIPSASIILGLIALQYMNLSVGVANVSTFIGWTALALSGLLAARMIRDRVIRHSKNHYENPNKKNNLSPNEKYAYDMGLEAKHSTVTWLYSSVSPTAITHPRAYYAGFEKGRHRIRMS